MNGNTWSSNCISWGVHPEAIRVDFELLISITRVVRSPMPLLRKINTSYTKSRWVRMHLSLILIPCSLPVLCYSIISLLRPSIMSKNKSGDRWHPYVSPLSEWNKGDANSLMRILNDMLIMQHMIHCINPMGKPRRVKRILIYNQLSRSKAFERSTLRNIPFNFFICIECNTSCVVPTDSCIRWSWRKENCPKKIWEDRMGRRWLAIILAMIL